MGFWTVIIHLRRCASCTPGKPSSRDRRGDKKSCSDHTCQTPHHLSCSDLGRAQNTGPTKSAPVGSIQEPEPELLRPGKCMQPRAHFRQFTCRATWRLSSVDWESTQAMGGGKPSVAETLQALPSYASDICLQCSSLPTARLNK